MKNKHTINLFKQSVVFITILIFIFSCTQSGNQKITIDTTNSPYGNVGIVAVIPIGMCQVSSVNMIATKGSNLLKGDEFGYFLFGGSDIIVLFQKGIDPQIPTGSQYRNYGTKIADCKKLIKS